MKYYIYTHIYIYVCEQSRKTLRRFTEKTSTNLGRSNRVPHVCTKMISGKLGGIACRKIYIMICLTPERRLCFLFDQAASLQDSELSEDVLLEEVLGKSLFPHRQVTVRVSEFEPCTTPRHTELPASLAWTPSLWRDNRNGESSSGGSMKTCTARMWRQLAASEANIFTGTCFPLLRFPFSADHSMNIKKNTFWGARALVSLTLHNSWHNLERGYR